MKKILVMAFAVMLLVLVGASAQASFVQIMNPVSIWAVDCYDAGNGGAGQDGEVVLAALTFSTGSSTLQYSLNQTVWNLFDDNGTTISMTSCKDEVFFRLNDGSDDYDYSATLTFMGSPGACCGLPVYNSVTMNWGDSGTTKLVFMSTSGGCDKLAPVPIPPSAAMLFFGLLGLFGVRRMRRDS